MSKYFSVSCKNKIILVCAFLTTFTPTKSAAIDVSNEFQNISEYIEDARLDFKQLAKKYGYPVEEHTIATEDGYILTLFRIPRGKSNGIGIGPPVLLMHGFSDSADSWIFPGPGYALGYLIADAGYDVWCGNYRGNKYSRKHKTLDPDKDVEFWKFSYDEMGAYDLPAFTNYVLNLRGLESMNYVGFSQGTTLFYTMSGYKPEYYEKFDIMVSLAPISWLTYLKNPHLRKLTKALPRLEALGKTLGLQEILSNSSLYARSLKYLCQRANLSNVCKELQFETFGYDEEQFRDELIPVIYGHTPCGASLQNLIHLGQGVGSNKFKHFDRGPLENLRIYGSMQPPEYNVSSITTPIALIYGKNDLLSSTKDVAKLRRRLPNVVDDFLVPRNKWQHADHIWGKEAPLLIGDRIVRLLNKYSK